MWGFTGRAPGVKTTQFMEERGSAVSSAARQYRILIVSPRHDEPVRAAASTLGQAGGAVTVVPDAYRAMAQLVQPPGFAHLLLDVRDMDEAELGIINIASRYSPATAAAAMELPGIEAKLSRLAPTLRVMDIATLAMRIGDGRVTSLQTTKATTERATPAVDDVSIEHSLGVDDTPAVPVNGDRPSADDAVQQFPPVGSQISDGGVSMYEAVRTRMREGAAPPVRRRPGDAATPFGSAGLPRPCDAPVTETGVELTAAEIDALLAIDEPKRGQKEESAS